MKARKIDVSMQVLTPMMEALLADGTDVELTATGNSMRPLWHHRRDVVKLTFVQSDDIKKWDVLLYRRGDGTYILHRVVKVGENTLDFLGDAQYGIEKGVPKENVVARVIGYRKNGKKYRSTNSLRYKIYVALWCNTRGIRYFFYRAFMRIKRLFGVAK